jgi:hypothetical protein
MINQAIPLKRHASAGEIAGTVLFLASEQSSFSTGSVPMVERGLDDPAKFFAENQRAIIGTPDHALAEIQRIWDGVGGFGGLLIFGMDWAPPPATWRSFELMAEYVRPRLSGANQARQSGFVVMHVHGRWGLRFWRARHFIGKVYNGTSSSGSLRDKPSPGPGLWSHAY